jgi:HSP20 family molecular chaperone IbpA
LRTASVGEDEHAAQFENGVLTVRVPKAAKTKPRRIAIGAADKAIEG